MVFFAFNKGYSATGHLSELAARFWLTAMRFDLHIWLDVVKSQANVADGPSRMQYDQMAGMCRVVPPNLDLLTTWAELLGPALPRRSRATKKGGMH